MIGYKLYLDTRRLKNNGMAPLRLALYEDGRTRYINLKLDLPPHYWDARGQCVSQADRRGRALAAAVGRLFDICEDAVLRGIGRGLSLDEVYTDVYTALNGKPRTLFAEVMERFMAGKSGGTLSVYRQTVSRLRAFCELDRLTFEDMTVEWLRRFEAFLARTANKNARNIHLRNIRAVFNFAIDEELTAVYPFRRFKIRPQPTRKRSLSLEQLHSLMDAEVEPWQAVYRDLFVLIFMLCGINIVDLCRLKAITAEGRIEYERAKTHRLYSVRVEPEARAIIDRYAGKEWLLFPLDRYGNHHDFARRMNHALQSIGECTRSGLGGKKHITPAFSGLPSVWAGCTPGRRRTITPVRLCATSAWASWPTTPWTMTRAATRCVRCVRI